MPSNFTTELDERLVEQIIEIMKTRCSKFVVVAVAALAVTTTTTAPAAAPSFSLAWSEYPSWSVFGVAHSLKLIDGAQGQQGPIEKKWNVDVVLKEAEYDPCLTMYGAAQCDAVCITTLDALNPSL